MVDHGESVQRVNALLAMIVGAPRHRDKGRHHRKLWSMCSVSGLKARHGGVAVLILLKGIAVSIE